MFFALDMFKIGIGPSSSHTLGPMKAARAFITQAEGLRPDRIVIDLYGSLSSTGLGHKTDQAILLGLAGYEPETVLLDSIPAFMRVVETSGKLPLPGNGGNVDFNMARDMIFHPNALPLHENGLKFSAMAGDNILLSQTWYSVGGGVVVQEKDFARQKRELPNLPYAFANAAELLNLCQDNGLSLAGLAMANELHLAGAVDIAVYSRKIWETMRQCMQRGMQAEGLLPGPLRLARRAPGLRLKLSGQLRNDPLMIMDWVNMVALAVSEENAAGGRVVTAPTNGACGVVPAIVAYYDKFITPLDDETLQRFFLCAGTIGQLFRMNASISGAEVGCQGEVGVACSMAAAGLVELMGGTPEQVCGGAEIAMEHNLGLTCDPVGGLVQIPCIERNAINAVKALNAARMALERGGRPMVSLDNIIEAMLATGKDMSVKYRETSQGGLAILPHFSYCA